MFEKIKGVVGDIAHELKGFVIIAGAIYLIVLIYSDLSSSSDNEAKSVVSDREVLVSNAKGLILIDDYALVSVSNDGLMLVNKTYEPHFVPNDKIAKVSAFGSETTLKYPEDVIETMKSYIDDPFGIKPFLAIELIDEYEPEHISGVLIN